MKIVNIDAPEALVEKVQGLMIPRFILDVIKPLEEKYYTILAGIQMVQPSKQYDTSTVILPTFPIRMFWEKTIGYENIATLIHTIPIYLRKKNPDRGEGIIDLLGAYYPNIKGDSPYIELFLTPISESTNGNDTQFKWLFTKVLLHELAHAALDIYNIEGFQNVTEQVSYMTPFGKWREESMANAVALNIIHIYGRKKFYRYAKDFILTKQPGEYKLGALLEEEFDHWDFESVISGKIHGVDSVLQQEWLTYVNGTPTAKGLKEWNEKLTS